MNEKISIFSDYGTNKNTFHNLISILFISILIDINKIDIKIINIIL